jgi:hypothetical protein
MVGKHFQRNPLWTISKHCPNIKWRGSAGKLGTDKIGITLFMPEDLYVSNLDT